MAGEAQIVLAVANDWEGVYVDGKLFAEEHSIPLDTLAEACGVKLSHIECDEEWLSDIGELPAKLADVKRAAR